MVRAAKAAAENLYTPDVEKILATCEAEAQELRVVHTVHPAEVEENLEKWVPSMMEGSQCDGVHEGHKKGARPRSKGLPEASGGSGGARKGSIHGETAVEAQHVVQKQDADSELRKLPEEIQGRGELQRWSCSRSRPLDDRRRRKTTMEHHKRGRHQRIPPSSSSRWSPPHYQAPFGVGEGWPMPSTVSGPALDGGVTTERR